MDDVEEAKDLIRSIRRSKRVDEDEGSDENANDLQGALRVYVVIQRAGDIVTDPT